MPPDVVGPVSPASMSSLDRRPVEKKRKYEAVYCKRSLTQLFEASASSAEKKTKVAINDKLLTEDYASEVEASLKIIPEAPENPDIVHVTWDSAQKPSPITAKEGYLEAENKSFATRLEKKFDELKAQMEGRLLDAEDEIEILRSQKAGDFDSVAVRTLMDSQKSALILAAWPGLNLQQIQGKRANWATTVQQLQAFPSNSQVQVEWNQYTKEEKEVLAMTSKDPSLPSHETALSQANNALHGRKASNMTNGELQGLIDSIERAMATKPGRLVGCERLFAKFSGYSSFLVAKQDLRSQRLKAIAARKKVT